MVQCEMCGAETASPKTVKIEGAELQVCDSCAEFGTEVQTADSGSTSTKYSTGSSSGSSTSSGGSSGGSSSGQRRRDMFDEMDEVVADYDDRIRKAREQEGLTQEELAQQISEKASLVRKLEAGDMLPSDDVQRKLEKKLGISLTESGGDDEDWESGGDGQGLTLGDMVKRKD